MFVERLGLGPLETNCWLVSSDARAGLLVIDPGGDAEELIDRIGLRTAEAIVLTHGHFDHLGAANEVRAATRAPLMVHVEDAVRLATDAPHGTGGALFGFAGAVTTPPDRLLEDGDVIDAGDLSFMVLHTPGHTEGGISLFVEDPDGGAPHLFSGDTLFAGSVGRTDFPGGDGRTLARSIATKLASLPPDTVVHPGHGPDTTIQRESRINPFWPRA